MTGLRQSAPSADEDSFVGTYFDQALRLREMESKAVNRLARNSIPFLAGSPHAELPPQDADSE